MRLSAVRIAFGDASVITIQSVMLVALGFLLATLIALTLAPAYRARAMRLTYRQIRRAIPLTDSEVLADRDRLRAQYAVRIHDLETKLEKARLTAARQQVEVNRRDASINALESELTKLRSELEQNVNARRVLEQTVTDRIPMLEQRLADTRSMLQQRDRELAAVTTDTGKSVRALDEVMQINAQQRSEIERLNATAATRTVRSRSNGPDNRFESEVALRSELEALRAKTRDQESLISRLQAVISGPQDPSSLAHANGSDSLNQDKELQRLRHDLAEAEAALKSVSEQSEAQAVQAGDEALKSKLQSLETLVAEQSATVRKLEAELSTYQQGDAAGKSITLKDSKIAMKARIAALQTEVEERTAMVRKLRAELASVNERLALQSAQFVEEMRRLRTGTPPGVATTGRRQTAGPARRSLAERIGDANPSLAVSLRTTPARNLDEKSTAAVDGGNGQELPDKTATAPPQPNDAVALQREHADNAKSSAEGEAKKTSAPESGQAGSRLLERIASLSKS